MTPEIKDLIWFAIAIGGILAVFFGLKQKVALVAQKVEDNKLNQDEKIQRVEEAQKKQEEKLDAHLQLIDSKLEKYFNKMDEQVVGLRTDVQSISIQLAKIK